MGRALQNTVHNTSVNQTSDRTVVEVCTLTSLPNFIPSPLQPLPSGPPPNPHFLPRPGGGGGLRAGWAGGEGKGHRGSMGEAFEPGGRCRTSSLSNDAGGMDSPSSISRHLETRIGLTLYVVCIAYCYSYVAALARSLSISQLPFENPWCTS